MYVLYSCIALLCFYQNGRYCFSIGHTVTVSGIFLMLHFLMCYLGFSGCKVFLYVVTWTPYLLARAPSWNLKGCKWILLCNFIHQWLYWIPIYLFAETKIRTKTICCSVYHCCTTLKQRFKPSLECVKDLQWWESLAMVPAGNKA